MKNKKTNYLFESWVQTCGEGWTKNQVLIAYLFSILFAALIILYSFIANLNWTGIQLFAAAWLAWDLGGGVIGYSHKSIKQKTNKEKGNLHFLHHNLLHIHPLILIFFNNPKILLGITIYSIISFFSYVELLEPNRKNGKRKISGNGEKWFIVFELVVAIILVIVSFFFSGIERDLQIFGILNYGSLILLTLLLIRVPISSQRMVSIMMVVSVIALSMFISIPRGFEWFIPLLFLKLLAGYTAKEEICE